MGKSRRKNERKFTDPSLLAPTDRKVDFLRLNWDANVVPKNIDLQSMTGPPELKADISHLQ
jgi:hypothetical protein